MQPELHHLKVCEFAHLGPFYILSTVNSKLYRLNFASQESVVE